MRSGHPAVVRATRTVTEPSLADLATEVHPQLDQILAELGIDDAAHGAENRTASLIPWATARQSTGVVARVSPAGQLSPPDRPAPASVDAVELSRTALD